MQKLSLILVFAFLTIVVLNAEAAIQNAASVQTEVIESTSLNITLSFELEKFETETVTLNGQTCGRFNLPGEGTTYESNKPKLPAISRFVVVPPRVGLELVMRSEEFRQIPAENQPELCNVRDITLILNRENEEPERLYPPCFAEMSEPVVIRGVRLVKVTTYPVQYDASTNEYLHRSHIETEIRFTGSEPVNPVEHPNRRHRSREFLKFIRAFAINGADVGRDDPFRDNISPYDGHYLVVTHENCLRYAAPFIEWRRKAGYKVDILSLPNNEALNTEIVSECIQDRYDEYLNASIVPFDQILLIGDLTDYSNCGPEAQWILDTPVGTSLWANPHHADYLYACLEGNDHHPDAGIARWPMGNPESMALTIGRTLSYEAEPFMDEPEWFTKGAVFSQHWGNNEHMDWFPYIHTNVRWGEEVLQHLGFDDIAYHEEPAWDRMGDAVGPFLRDQLNEGRNLLIGMAQNYYWRQDFDEVNDNVIFPIFLNVATKSTWTTHNMFRRGDENHLKGPVAASSLWGEPEVVPMCMLWLGLVKGVLNHDLTLGWGRVFAITSFEGYIPNIQMHNRSLYLVAKTDLDFIGDPGIQPWIGIPREVQAEFIDEVSPIARLIEVHVIDPDNDENIPGAKVSLYAPGDIPNADEENYADYDEMIQLTSLSDNDGIVRFVLSDEVELVPDTPVYITVTGRDILPFFGNVEIIEHPVAFELTEYRFEEVEGNGDDDLNPGEVFNLHITARNMSQQDMLRRITAVITSLSPYVEVEGNEIDFEGMGPGDEAEGEQLVQITLSPFCPDGSQRPETRPVLQIEFRWNNDFWHSVIELDPVAPKFAVLNIVGGNVIPIDFHPLDIDIENSGRLNASETTVELHPLDAGVSVIREESTYPAIEAGGHARLEGNDFIVTGNTMSVPGSVAKMMMIFQTENEFIDSVFFDLQVRQAMANAPQGPDDYGYICLDDTDEDWMLTPEYDWVEISLRDDDRDFNGILLDFEGESQFDIGEPIVIDLPFETQFYGELFDQVTVCTKGFIAMGDQPRITNYTPWPMDQGIGGGAGTVAPFWADIDLEDNSGVYVFHDEDECRFIIEYHELHHHTENEENLTFQVILYDHDVWITETGDQPILFQYQSIANPPNLRNDERNAWLDGIPFASVGISSPDGTTGINYTYANEYPITSAELENGRAILFTTSQFTRQAAIHGQVTDAETGDPIPNAWLLTNHGFMALVDEEGFYRIEYPAELPFSITAGAQGYNPLTIDVEGLEPNENREVNFELTHPEFELSPNSVEFILNQNDSISVPIEITNNGNGQLEWTATRNLIGEANRDPWELRHSYRVGEQVDDTRIQGVIFADDMFYISGRNDQNPVIYIFDREGNHIDQFAQPVQDDRRGMRDLAWDGELIWGAVNDSIYGITTEGEVIHRWRGPYDLNSGITWDPDREAIWVCYIINNPVAYTQGGERIDSLEVDRRGLRILGLAYWSDDPDGYCLYALHRESHPYRQLVYKFNIETNDTMFVTYLDPEHEGSPEGAFITNQYDIYSWVFMSISNLSPANGGDHLDVWQLDVYKDWFGLDTYADSVMAEERQEINLTLNSNDLEYAVYEGEIRFCHNADSGLAILPVTLEVSPDVIDNSNNDVIPLEFGIVSAYPNPFNPSTTITYSLPYASNVTLEVFDLSGRKVCTLVDGYGQAGIHSVVLGGEVMTSGLYLVRFEAAGNIMIQKVALIR